MDGIVAQLKAIIGLDTSDFSRGTSAVKAQMAEMKATAATLGTALTAAFTVPAVAAAKLGAEFVQMKQSAEIAFSVMLKSGDKAKALFKDLQAFAAATPFDLPDVVKNTQRLTAMGFAAKDAIPLMRVLGDATAAVGGNGDSLNRIALAIGQIRTAGTLKTEDLNQLVEAGLPVFDILSKKMHKSVSEIRDQLQKGAISSKQALDTIVGSLDERYGGVMAKMGATWQTTVSNLQDNAQQMLGSLFEPAIKGATGFVQSMTTQLGRLRDYFGSLSEDTRKKIAAVIAILAGIGPAILLINGLGTAFAALATPVGLVVAAVAAFAAAYATNFFHVRDVTNQVVSAVGNAIEQVGPYVMLAAQFVKIGFEAWVEYAKWMLNFYISIPTAIANALKSVGTFIAGTFTAVYENAKGAVAVVGQTFQILAQYFQSASGVAGGLGTVFGRVWNTISEMTATGVRTVVGLIGSMLERLGEMTGAKGLVQTAGAVMMALENGFNVLINANKSRISGLMDGIKGAVSNFKLPDWKGFSGAMPDAGQSKGDKAAHDKAIKDALNHAKRLAEIYAEMNATIYANAHKEAEVERRNLAIKVAEYRKSGVSKAKIDEFIASESLRIHNAAQKKIDDATAENAKKQIAAATEAARGILSTIDNLADAKLISYQQERQEILDAMHLVSVTADEKAAIFRSGNEGQILLLKKLNEIDKKHADEEIARAKKVADFKAKYNFVGMGKLGMVPLPKNLKPKETDAEKYAAVATKSLAAALQDAQAGFSTANSHANRFSEVLAKLNLDYAKLTDEQKRTLTEIVKWDEATARLEKYKRKLEAIKGEAKGILSSAFEGALNGSEKFFDSIKKSFTQMLIRMAAESAASQVVKMLMGMAGLDANGLKKDSEKARNNMVIGATAITAAAASLSAAAATLAASGTGFGGAGLAGAGAGLSAATGAAGAAKSGGLLGAGLSKTLGYVGIGLAADQMLFKGAISKTVSKGLGSVAKGVKRFFGFAGGGRPPVGKDFVAGEEGPEIVRIDRPATVFSNAQSQSLLENTGGSGGGVTIHNATFHDRADVERVRATILAKKRQKARLA